MIYAIYCQEFDKVKLGYSEEPISRLNALAVSHWTELDLVHSEQGTIEEERYIHSLLKPYNLRGEWYTYEDIKHFFPYIFTTWSKTNCIDNLVKVNRIEIQKQKEESKELKRNKYEESLLLKKVKTKKKPKYQQILKTYIDLVKESKNNNLPDYELELINNKINLIESTYKEFKKALDVLGEIKLKALRHQKSLVEQELLKIESKRGRELQVVELLDFRNGQFTTSADLKIKLKHVYTELNLNTRITAKEINNYYRTKLTMRRIDGKQTKGYEILYPLYK